MIVFDLRCAAGHVFEAWFGSSEDYDAQAARGLVACPMCGDQGVEKAMMAPHVGAKGNRAPSESRSVAVAASPADPAAVKAALRALAEAQAKMLESSTYVGVGFAKEARAIHLGEVEHRPIHGQATVEEAKTLIDEGIPVAPLPLPLRPPRSDN